MRKILIGIWMIAIFFGCGRHMNSVPVYDGRLEADIVRLPARIAGTIDSLVVDEGDRIVSGQIMGKINADRLLALKRQQIAQLKEIRLNRTTLFAQIRQVEPQLNLARETLRKTELLYQKGTATEQLRDEAAARVEVLLAQLDGLNAQMETVASKADQLAAGIEITDLNLKDSHIRSPLNGLVLNSYREVAEMVNTGTVVFDVADLSGMEARIYLPLEDLARVRIGCKAMVRMDGAENPFEGSVSWIASESEFTPKTILTEETRTTLVYAVKIRLPNPDGILKIGIPVQVEILPYREE